MNSLLQQTTQAFLEALMILPRETWNEYIDQFADYLAKEFSAEYEDIKAEYNKQAEKIIMMVDSVDVDILDVTGLEPQQARQLALTLCQWNGGGPCYQWRGNRRYLNRRIRKIDLANSFIQSLSGYDDLVKNLKGEIYYERI